MMSRFGQRLRSGRDQLLNMLDVGLVESLNRAHAAVARARARWLAQQLDDSHSGGRILVHAPTDSAYSTSRLHDGPIPRPIPGQHGELELLKPHEAREH